MLRTQGAYFHNLVQKTLVCKDIDRYCQKLDMFLDFDMGYLCMVKLKCDKNDVVLSAW